MHQSITPPDESKVILPSNLRPVRAGAVWGGAAELCVTVTSMPPNGAVGYEMGGGGSFLEGIDLI